MKCKIIRSILFATMLLLSGFFITSCEKEVEGVTEIIFTNVRSGKVSLSVGEEFTVKCLVLPEHLQETAQIDWETSDRKVARVRRGVIEAEGPGEATITASSGKAKATILVKVTAVQVEDFDLPDAIEVYLGATVKVTFENVDPDDGSLTTVEWVVGTEGEDGGAEVTADDNCIYVTGTKEGVVTLYGYIDGVEIDHQEIVIKERIPVTSVSVTLSKPSVTFGESLTVSAYIEPSNASLKDVTITCTPSNLATVSGNTITAGNQAGTVTVRATADGVSGTAEFEIVPPPLELDVLGDFGENNGTFLSPDGSVRSFQKTAQLSLKANYDVDLSEVEWTSSNPAVATVDNNGLVTAAGHGWTDITAKVTTIHGEGTGSLRVRSVKGSSFSFYTERYDFDVKRIQTTDMSTTRPSRFNFFIKEKSFANDTELPHYLLWETCDFSFEASSDNSKITATVNTYEPDVVWLSASEAASANITLTPNYGQPLRVTSTMGFGSVSFVGVETGNVYATVLNGKSVEFFYPSDENVYLLCNPGTSYNPVTADGFNEHTWTWEPNNNHISGKLLYWGGWTNRTASTTDAFGGFSFTFTSK